MLLLVDGAVPPAALLLVVPDALPEPEDWLVCALWLADTPAFTSELLMPTFASTPTDGAVEPLGALGCEVLGWLGCAL